MMEKDKNKIDEIFKGGLSDAKFDFNESHWQDIELRLNRESRLKKKKVFILTALAAAAVLVLCFIWNSDVLNRSSDTLHERIVVSKKTDPEKDVIHPSEVLTGEHEQEKEWDALQPKEVKDAGLENRAVAHLWRNEFIDTKEIKYTSAQSANLNRIFTIPQMEHKVAMLPGFTLKVDSAETRVGRLVTVYYPKENEEPGRSQKEQSVISFLVGPDLTRVKGADKSSLSENIGVAYSYPLTKGLSVSVGAIYAKKNYKSAYKFYAPSNSPELTQLPSSVSAVCDVIDVPLTANYTVLKNKKIKFNISAGLSSYFMLKEKYTFDYEGEGSYGGDKKSAVYEVKGENQHIFGVADFSISIEKKINDKINIGVKPFVKMPLTGIGYGNVDLESKGVAFTVGMSL